MDKAGFIKASREFRLGGLATESVRESTKDLSALLKRNPAAAVALLRQVDLEALAALEQKLEEVYRLRQAVVEAMDSGGRVFLCGCGATGRLSLALETFWKKAQASGEVVGFMAGGDYALIRSVERFEDESGFGERQLVELGFNENDLLLAITEGGETSFVIGAAEAAARVSRRKPFFIYCNPDHQLISVRRSRAILENERVEKLNLFVGPMALTGSTRMQATTVQMLAGAMALFLEARDEADFLTKARLELDKLRTPYRPGLEELVAAEAEVYLRGGLITYLCDEDSAITVLTDTTERSPTFSLPPFEKTNDPDAAMSLAYLAVQGAENPETAWKLLLGRTPRGLNWETLDIKLDHEELYRFDISEQALTRRARENHRVFYLRRRLQKELQKEGEVYALELENRRWQLSANSSSPVFNEIALKMALNIHSTLVMGVLGRYEGNLMTYVRPSNYKLIDRAARYVVELAKRRGIEASYEQAVEEIFRQIPTLAPDEPVTLKVLEVLAGNQA